MDYRVLIEDLAEPLEREEFRMLERGSACRGACSERLSGGRKITVAITKLQVPMDREVSGIAVEATFSR